ncbi:MAG: rhodanese-like domain-containing protein [Chloroflexota bacterium]
MAQKSKKKNKSKQNGIAGFLRQPFAQIGILVVVVIVIVGIALSAQNGSGNTSSLPADVTAVEGYKLVQDGAFLLDVRRQDEWDQYHAIGATLIPLDELPNRLNELPKDKQIVVICHSGNRSKPGRDILLQNGFQATSVTGGLLQWYADNLPFTGSTPQ